MTSLYGTLPSYPLTNEGCRDASKVNGNLQALETAIAGKQTAATALAAIAALSPADGNIIVGDGSVWVAESGATARTSLGLGTGDSPAFAGATLSGTFVCSATARATQFGAGGAPAYPFHAHVDGAGAGTRVACMLEAGNAYNYYGNSQLGFGYHNSPDYAQCIRSRHNGTSQANNAIDFYLWSYGGAASAVTGTWGASVDGYGVNAKGYRVSGTTGLSGVLVLDDGANWRVSLTFAGGILTAQSISASSAATATWT